MPKDNAGFILVTLIHKAWKQTDKITGKVTKEGKAYAYTNTAKETISTFGFKTTKNVTLKGEAFGGSSTSNDSHIVFNWIDDEKFDFNKFVDAHCGGNYDKPQFYYHPIDDRMMSIAEYEGTSEPESTQEYAESPM